MLTAAALGGLFPGTFCRCPSLIFPSVGFASRSRAFPALRHWAGAVAAHSPDHRSASTGRPSCPSLVGPKTPTRRSQDAPGGIPALPAPADGEGLAVLLRRLNMPDPARGPAPPAPGARQPGDRRRSWWRWAGSLPGTICRCPGPISPSVGFASLTSAFAGLCRSAKVLAAHCPDHRSVSTDRLPCPSLACLEALMERPRSAPPHLEPEGRPRRPRCPRPSGPEPHRGLCRTARSGRAGGGRQ